MKNKKFLFIIGVILVAIVFILLPKGGKAPEQTAPEMALDDKKVVSIDSDAVKKGEIENTVFTIGTIDPVEIFDVNAKVSGTVLKANFEVGDHVNKDDVLFTIDKANFETTRDASLSQLKNSLEQARTSRDKAQDDYDKELQLFETGAASQSSLDSAKIALDNAVIAYNNAASSYNSQAANYSDQLDNYVQKSPVSGVIVSKNISKDIYASTQNGYSIITEDAFVVNATISSKYVKSIAKGQKASIYVNTIDKQYTGEVLSVSSVGKNGSYPVEISIAGDDNLMSGLYSEIEISVDSVKDAMLIAKKALIYEGDKVYVYKINDDNTVKKVEIQVGIVNGEHVQLISGLNEGDKVVTLGKEYVTEGVAVKE